MVATPLRRKSTCVPSESTSTAPDRAIAAPVRRARERVSSAAAGRVPSVTASPAATSTPLPPPWPRARARISEALPRMTAKCTSESRRPTASRRREVTPAATGSSTTGMPRALARFPARSMASRSPMAPRLHTRAWTPATASSTSRTSWDMVGEPPAARMMLAQSLTVTKLVMHCTRGARARTERRRAAKSSCSISTPHRLSSSSIRSSTLARLSSRSTAQPIRPPTTEAGR